MNIYTNTLNLKRTKQKHTYVDFLLYCFAAAAARVWLSGYELLLPARLLVIALKCG